MYNTNFISFIWMLYECHQPTVFYTVSLATNERNAIITLILLYGDQ